MSGHDMAKNNARELTGRSEVAVGAHTGNRCQRWSLS